jgi:uncharacterized protein (DUF1015 family)
MVHVAPFKGIQYNKTKIKDLNKVMSPPYDIISDKLQQELYDNNPYNFVRLILNKIQPTDTDTDNRYTRAHTLFEEWQKTGILAPSSTTAIYPYRVDYTVKNEKKTMHGFFVLLKLDPDYKTVKAHEKTLAKPKADRLNLMRTCDANLEPIQLMYMDDTDQIRKTIENGLGTPQIQVKGYDGFTHNLWKLDDPKTVNAVQAALKEKILFIADGHHRYQTSINFAAEKREQTKNTDPNAPFNNIMVVLCNMFDPGLSILPTHRLITMPDIDFDQLQSRLQEFFTIEKIPLQESKKNFESLGKKIMTAIETAVTHKFAMYTKDAYWILTLKDERIMDKLAADHSKTWRSLDVSILHKLILEQLLGINEKNLEDHVKYTRVDAEALQLVDEGKFNFSFLINATKIDQLKAIADAHEVMPQKSTYFLPKMLSGLVMYKM